MIRIALCLIVLIAPAAPAKAGDDAEPETPIPNPYVATANRTLSLAGLPVLPSKAEKLQCYAWDGLSAGIYASFILKEPELTSYLASFGSAGLETASPIPQNLLAAPISNAPWFSPGAMAEGTVFYRGRIVNAAPELFRLYLDPKKSQVFLYYTWNNKGIYP